MGKGQEIVISEKVARMNDENLVKFTPENARERQLKSAAKRKENNERRKLLSEIYGDFLAEEFDIQQDGQKRKISGAEYCKLIAKTVLKRSDSSSVAMLKEIRESTEGSKMQINASVSAEMETTEDRIKKFEELVK